MVEIGDFKPTLTPAFAAELLGSFLAIFFAGSTAATAADNGLSAASLGYGLAMAIMIYATAHISGGHLNPATTVAYMVTNAHGFSIQEGISYMVAQFLGAILGAFTLKLLLPAEALAHPFVTLGSLSDKHWGQVLILEFVCTLMVVFVVFGAMVDRKRSLAGNAGPLAVGFAYSIAVFACGPFTGGSLNPARTLGPAVAFGEFSHIWVYFFATFLGGAAAGLAYKMAFDLDEPSAEDSEGTPVAKYV